MLVNDCYNALLINHLLTINNNVMRILYTMKHICKTIPTTFNSASFAKRTTEKFKPLSYYLNGGIDLTGRELDTSAEVEYDNEQEFNDIVASGAMAVPYGDPRESKFTLLERYGSETAFRIAQKSNNSVADSDSTPTD